MPALNFKKQFSELVAHGQKQQTIRKRRKIPLNVGDKLYLYTGMRTKSCEKLGEGTVSEVFPIVIDHKLITFKGTEYQVKEPFPPDLFEMAEADGFVSVRDMMQWFEYNYGLPFEGDVIKWKYNIT